MNAESRRFYQSVKMEASDLFCIAQISVCKCTVTDIKSCMLSYWSSIPLFAKMSPTKLPHMVHDGCETISWNVIFNFFSLFYSLAFMCKTRVKHNINKIIQIKTQCIKWNIIPKYYQSCRWAKTCFYASIRIVINSWHTAYMAIWPIWMGLWNSYCFRRLLT